MKNLNKNTSREEFKKRISLNDTSGMDLFDQDAFEGYSKNPESFRLLEKLDKKFRPNIKVNYFLITLFSFITIIGYFVYTNVPTKSTIQKRAKTVSSTNTNISDEQLYINSKTTNKSTFDKKIKSELFVKKNNSKNNSSEINHGIEINLLNKKGIKEIQSIVSQSKIKKISAKERYIDKFLIVDYSVYRSTPINESNALKTGTPANVEYTKNTNLQDDMKDSTTSTYFDFLEETLSLFKKNEFTKANLNFQTILLNYPDDINAFHRSTICSAYPYLPQALWFGAQFLG